MTSRGKQSVTSAVPLAGRYRDVSARIRSLCAGETDPVALMATMACELYQSMPGFDWVGFYRVAGPETLKIGPYQGGHGCLVIPFARGVCGAVARERRTKVVADVDAFPGHIACAASTRSEIVVPVLDGAGRLIAVLDIDSDTPCRFDAEDASALETLCREVFATAAAEGLTAASAWPE
jgi:GAF domain-containing protein